MTLFMTDPVDSALESDNSLLSMIGQALVLPTVVCAAGLVLFWSLPASAQSFSCASADTPAEFAVCNSEDLLAMDETIETKFASIYVGATTAPERQAVSREQSEWLKRRDACGANFTCLNLRYEERMEMLNRQS
ncbi:MAG: hypothetical protein KDJ80_12460 [Nitratireductor sp.]|nr:hypothetical protein [Nitratireductor sp.]